jgi:hypothetical protein
MGWANGVRSQMVVQTEQTLQVLRVEASACSKVRPFSPELILFLRCYYLLTSRAHGNSLTFPPRMDSFI